VKEYYDTRASEYDEWYLGLGKFAGLGRRDWDEDVRDLTRTLAALPPARTLDIACGTGFLTQHLRGEITALDQSDRMLAIARERVHAATFIRGDALELPFADQAFDRVFTSHFYGHLEQPDRDAFLAEARRVAPELVVADSALAGGRARGHEQGERQERILNDGSRFVVYKRYFDGRGLAAELGGGSILHESSWFVVVSSTHT
jgi:demethylmenaquinone methyltransferase/2-methoxy-6-polyprenyl-1,4-benzoquinol methylase